MQELGTGNAVLQRYVDDGLLNPADIETLTVNQQANVSSKVVRSLFDSSLLNYQEVLNLTIGQRVTLEKDKTIREQFEARNLLLKLVNYPAVQKYVDDGSLKPDQIDGLQFNQLFYLNSDVIRSLFEGKHFTYQQILDLNASQWQALKDAGVVEKIKQGKLSYGLIENPVMQEYVNSGLLELAAIGSLTKQQKLNVNSAVARQLVVDGHLQYQEVLDLRDSQRVAFEDAAITDRFKAKKLSLQWVDLAVVQKCIDEGSLKQADMLNLTFNQLYILNSNDEIRAQVQQGKLPLSLVEYPLVQQYVVDGFLKPEQIDGLHNRLEADGKTINPDYIAPLTAEQKLHLNTPAVYALVKEGAIKIAQALSLSSQQFNGLKDAATVEQVRQKTLILVGQGFIKANSAAPKSAMHAPAPVEAAAAPRQGNDAAAQRQAERAAKK